ncbi:Uncharacterised protein [Clostridium perfringens]|uniref:Uncharacterized protein n=1 Tax=Clostridium perfringens TaxID=1502 RepID=A0A2X3E6D2_CLOPF|nr:hypothetical protein [Clostridium perfringens]SQC06070.1 Uncharacterised protein [Clostridium perfringens]
MKNALKLTFIGFLIILVGIYLAVSDIDTYGVYKVLIIVGVILAGFGIKSIK